MSFPLQWTGHPMVDAGLAAVTAFAGKSDPGQLERPDLQAFGKFAEKAYFTPELMSFLSVLFTRNFIHNPSFSEDRKHLEVTDVFRSIDLDTDPALPPCAYCSGGAVMVAHRDLVPMLTGREAVNFFPGGDPGLAVCGYCIVAIQALAIGAPFVSGRALVVDTDDRDLLQRLVANWQREARKRIALSAASGEKLPGMSRPLTRLTEALDAVDDAREDAEAAGLSVLLLSNSGQGPGIEIHRLPAVTMRFFRRVRAQRYRGAWFALVTRAWEISKKGDDRREAQRNFLYEDLFLLLPDRPGKFLRRHFLLPAIRLARGLDADLPVAAVWELTQFFVKEVIRMDEQRIAKIRTLADSLADHVTAQNDRRLWGRLFRERSYAIIRGLLLRVNDQRLASGAEPAVNFEEFVDIFEASETNRPPDWRLAWDLVLLRVIDRLHATGWIAQHRDEVKAELAELENDAEMQD